MTKRRRVLIVDDHAIVREGVKGLLSALPHLEVVGEAADGREAISLAVTLNPDLVITDLCMPGSNGTEVISGVKRRCPNTKIIVLTVHKSTEHIRAALDAGADGYVVKTDTGSELLAAIESIERGKTYLSPSICKQVVNA
jgi:DNA-binding NarL/FixJ family response regulator